jgi:CAAX protease family protein
LTILEKKAAFILAGIAATEGTWLYFNLAGRAARFWRYTGFLNPAAAGFLGWTVAFAAAALFTWRAAMLPAVRENLLRPSVLKVLGILVAITAGFCEETIFRKWLMDALQTRGFGLMIQTLTSAITFGLAHGVWGLFRGSIRTFTGAMAAASVLGFMLAVVYITSHRILVPCIVSHFLINLFIEPGLVLAAVRGEMGTARIQ